MRRQIILEIEEEGTENIVADIIGMMRDKVDMNCEFRISQKILPEKFPRKRNKDSCIFSEQLYASAGEGNGKSHLQRGERSDDSWLVQQSKCCGDLRSLRNFQ